jgi:dienelactone hydrolase
MTHEPNDFPLPQPSTPAVSREGQRIPSVLFAPPEPRGLLLACHGGSGHKLSPAILAIARAALPLGLGVLAIDGPVHGERRTDGDLEPATARQAFREAWRSGVGRTSMAEDMRAALDAVLLEPAWSGLPLGYIGVSMGTAYGVPLLAVEPRIRAAVIGLWGTTYAASEHLAALARDVSCPTWFTVQWNDEFFDRDGTLALFDSLGSPDKRLVAYPGPHKELEGDRLDDAIEFLARRLTG